MTRQERRARFVAIVGDVCAQRGQLSADVREAAARGAPVPSPLAQLVQRIRASATQVTDDDVADARAAGHDDDQLFELTVATALGESRKRLRAVLAALGRGTEG